MQRTVCAKPEPAARRSGHHPRLRLRVRAAAEVRQLRLELLQAGVELAARGGGGNLASHDADQTYYIIGVGDIDSCRVFVGAERNCAPLGLSVSEPQPPSS
jgi:hypothetical protein